MNKTITIAPVRKSIVVEASAEQAFNVFTAGVDRWWPKSHNIGETAILEVIIEPFEGGRWYTKNEDGREEVFGHVLVWQPGKKFTVTWEINASWKADPRAMFTSEIEVLFHAETATLTRVDLEHRHFERMGMEGGTGMREGVDSGWPGLLEMFNEAVRKAA